MAERWIRSQGDRTLVNVETGIMVEAVRDQRDVWVIRIHAENRMVDVARTEGPNAQARVEDAFDKFEAWLLREATADAADVFPMVDAFEDDADDVAPA